MRGQAIFKIGRPGEFVRKGVLKICTFLRTPLKGYFWILVVNAFLPLRTSPDALKLVKYYFKVRSDLCPCIESMNVVEFDPLKNKECSRRQLHSTYFKQIDIFLVDIG